MMAENRAPDRGNSKCKVPEEGLGQDCLRYQKARMALKEEVIKTGQLL